MTNEDDLNFYDDDYDDYDDSDGDYDDYDDQPTRLDAEEGGTRGRAPQSATRPPSRYRNNDYTAYDSDGYDESPTELRPGYNNSTRNYRGPVEGAEETQLPGSRSKRRYQTNDDIFEKTKIRIQEDESSIQPLGFFITKRPIRRRGRVYQIRGTKRNETLIGKTRESDINLTGDDYITSAHAHVWLDSKPDDNGDPIFWLYDLNSANGTFIVSYEDEGKERRRIRGEQRLKEGDEVHIGDHIFTFKILKD